jgi:hypothetical protein
MESLSQANATTLGTDPMDYLPNPIPFFLLVLAFVVVLDKLL